MRRAIIAIVLLLLAVVGAAALWFGSVLEFSCEDEVLDEVRSPDGELVATIFYRGCGATTGYNRQVSIRKRSEEFQARRGLVFVAMGSPDVRIIWDGNHGLTIVHGPAEVRRSEKAWKSVQIKYAPSASVD